MDEISVKDRKQAYLKRFPSAIKPRKGLGMADIDQTSQQVLSLLKDKDLTHEEAYAVLQYTYKLIEYESNFLSPLSASQRHQFEKDNHIDQLFSKSGLEDIGSELVELLKRTAISYAHAFESLQYTYDLIKYESNLQKLS